MSKKRSMMAIGMILLVITGATFLLYHKKGVTDANKAEAEVRKEMNQKPRSISIPFIKNEGQTDRSVSYYAKTFGGTLFVTEKGELVYSLPKHEEKVKGKVKDKEKGTKIQAAVVTEEFVGAEVKEVKAERESETKVSYFIGDDKNRHRSGISTYERVSLGEIYRGIELRLKAYGNNVEKLFYVRPKAKPEEIKVGISGSRGIGVNEEGELVVETALGEVKFTKPVAYQEVDGKRRAIEVGYRIEKGENQNPSVPSKLIYAFRVGEYDKTKDLVIDPLLQSTFIGGSGMEGYYGNFGVAIAIHPTTGDVYITGITSSNDFPGTAGGADTSSASSEAFVSRLNSTLTTLIQSTFLGGSNIDHSYGIAIHPTTGDVYVTGYTWSNDFPQITGGADITFGGNFAEAFVSRLNSSLTTLLQSTFLGGSNEDVGRGIAIHPTTGDVYVTGATISETGLNDFPGIAGGADITYWGYAEAFVSRLNSTLTTLFQSTYLGGSSDDEGYGIAIHPTTGDVYVTGYTMSNDFPQITGGADATSIGGQEAFVSRLNSTLTTLFQATYLGGSVYEGGHGIAIHPTTGDVYVTGWTASNDFPGTTGGADATSIGGQEAFVSRLNSTLTTLFQSTYLGGSDIEEGWAIAIHPTTGDVYVTGGTRSNDFPGITGGADTTFAGTYEAFVSRLNSGLTTLFQSTYLGGSDDENGYGIAIHPTTGDVYVTGYTYSSDFPQIAGGADTTFENYEAFISRLTSSLAAVDPTITVSAVPTLTEWGMIILTILLGAGSVYYLRRRRLAV